MFMHMVLLTVSNTDPAAAVKRADAQTGVVLNRAQQYVWERGNKKQDSR